ncbi:MAG: aminotransferase class V-fold PLP-dependent enzyme [Clostridia bacterium]|nr:aminotransferase class V-fold PLP-dependent enzyme [Clostridia bacterium]
MIYFDNAATSFPKPLSVYREVEHCIKNYCGNPGRGSHSLSRRSAEKVYETREKIADFFGSPSPENVFFTYNDTYALNMVIKGLVNEGDHVIISDMEHNSVYRPIAALAENGIISYDIFDTMCLSHLRTPERICANIRRLIRRETKMLIATHVSNICSAALPLREIGELCRAHGMIFVVDAAQSAGHLPINMAEMKIDALCAPGHKGLYGLQGSGFALLRDGLLPFPIIEGGSGVNSLMPEMPEVSPERYEAGTLSVPCIASLCEGVEFVKSRGIDAIHEHESALYRRLSDMLYSLPEIKLYAHNHVGSTLLFNIDGIPCEKAADLLDRRGICVRSGFHCSPLGHKTLGTIESGAVRVSFSPFNTMRELEFFYSALKSIICEK